MRPTRMLIGDRKRQESKAGGRAAHARDSERGSTFEIGAPNDGDCLRPGRRYVFPLRSHHRRTGGTHGLCRGLAPRPPVSRPGRSQLPWSVVEWLAGIDNPLGDRRHSVAAPASTTLRGIVYWHLHRRGRRRPLLGGGHRPRRARVGFAAGVVAIVVGAILPILATTVPNAWKAVPVLVAVVDFCLLWSGFGLSRANLALLPASVDSPRALVRLQR